MTIGQQKATYLGSGAFAISKPKRSKNAPQIEGLHESLIQVLGGRNPTRIIGIGDHSLLQLISEVGTDLSLFPTKYRFTSWLGLAPGTNQLYTTMYYTGLTSGTTRTYRAVEYYTQSSNVTGSPAFTFRTPSRVPRLTSGTDIALDAVADRKSTRLNSSHIPLSRMPSSA